MNSPEIRYVLVSSHTCDGFASFMADLVHNLRRVYVLKGAADELASDFIKRWGEFFHEKGCFVEFWVSALNPYQVDGAYVPSLGAALIKGNLPEPVEPLYPGIRTEFINLGDYWAGKIKEDDIKNLDQLAVLLQQEKEKALKMVKEAGRLKEEMYRLSVSHLDFKEVKRMTEELCREINREYRKEKHYFASAFTGEGFISYLEEMSRRCYRRYILKGPSGSGKSTVISNIAAFCKEKGLSLTYYHNGLDKEKLDMIIIEDLGLAVIDGGEKGMVKRPGDVVIDMGRFLEFYDQEEAYYYIDLSRSYEEKLIKAQEHMKKWHEYLQAIDKIYQKAADFELLEKKREELNEFLLK